MKKIITTFASILAISMLAACGTTTTTSSSSDSSSTSTSTSMSSSSSAVTNKVTVKSMDATKKLIDKEVPYNPSKVAVIGMESLDILTKFGLKDRVVGTVPTRIDYLKEYNDDAKIKNLGTLKTVNMEALVEVNPEIIFIGSRLASSIPDLEKVAPVVFLGRVPGTGIVESTKQNVETVAKIFGKESEVEGLMKGIDERINKLKEISKGKTAIVGMSTKGGFNVLGNDGRCSIIGMEVGFDNIAGVDVTTAHGNETSFEFIVKKNPDYIFVMDRDAAIGTEGAKLAKEVMENDLVKKTSAYKNGNIVYLNNSAVWYMAEGGITALDIMLKDLEMGLVK